MDKPLRILMLEDAPEDAELMENALRKEGVNFVSTCVETREEFVKALGEFHADIILSDYSLPAFDGLSALKIAKENCPDVPFIIVTGILGGEDAVATIKSGATDYVLKDKLYKLPFAVNRAISDANNRLRFRREHQELLESERRFRLVAETITEVFWMADVDLTKMVYVSPGYERVWGRSCGSLYENPQSFIEAIHPEDRDRALADLRVQKEGIAFDHEYRIIRPDGSIRWIWDRGYPALAEDGRIDCYAGVAQDITDRKLMELELKDSEEKFRAMARSANDAIITIDGEGTIIYCNKAAERMFGHPCAEIIGQSAVIIVPEKFRSLHKEGLEKFKKTGEGAVLGKPVEITARRADGSEFPVELVVSGFVMKGRWHATGIIRDITERKKWEASLEESNRQLKSALENLNKTQAQLVRSAKLAALGELSAGVAHEIKNPLNIISTTIQLMMMEDNVAEETVKSCRTVMEQVNRAVKITENLRSFARERQPEVTDVNVCDLMEKTVALVQYEMRSENIMIEKACPPEAPIIKADPDQLAQVYLNLISNARDSMNEKQKCLSYDERAAIGWSGLLKIETRIEGPWVYVRFTDNGMGIPRRNMEKLFDPFFTTKEEGKGTGLGLSIAYGIIEAHGGRIEVESAEGEGAAFTIVLPLKAQNQEPQISGG